MKIHYLEAKQNKERKKIAFRKGGKPVNFHRIQIPLAFKMKMEQNKADT
jgi:hypothetical protein